MAHASRCARGYAEVIVLNVWGGGEGARALFMPIFSLDAFGRDSLIVCDSCGSVMGPNGERTLHTHPETEPEVLAQFYGHAGELREAGKHSGWRESGEVWMCPRCRGRTTGPRRVG